MRHIRNFSIIAHIDHGKSTLADRFIQRCGGLSDREMSEQVLDSMDLERERGITIKAQTAALTYRARDGKRIALNLIDTPGHVDFAYEVSRSLAACEGALLVVDASQGVEAQTVANCYTAIEQGVEVVPVLNKIDLPSAEPERVIDEIEDIIGIDATDAVRASAKNGDRHRRHPRSGDRADAAAEGRPGCAAVGADHRLVVRQLRRRRHAGARDARHAEAQGQDPADGGGRDLQLRAGRRVHAEARWRATRSPPAMSASSSRASRRSTPPRSATRSRSPAGRPRRALPGFKEVKPQVFAGLYPVESNQYEALRDALDKLKLNDASLHYEPEVSQALGFGFRCGFLGLLHMDIVQERLEREYDMDLITTAPTVVYQVLMRDGTVLEIENPSKLPDLSRVEEIREPIITATILMPQEYVGPVITLCTEKRGVQKNMQYLGRQVMLTYELPMAEVVMDFFDKLKSVSRGYASLDYEFKEFRAADVVKLDILINGERVDALSVMVHRSVAIYRGREVADEDAQADPAPDVRRRGAGVDRRADHRARDDQGDAQERARQVLRRRHHAQEEAAREAEGRQEADESRRQRRDPAGGVPGDPAGRREVTPCDNPPRGQLRNIHAANVAYLALTMTTR